MSMEGKQSTEFGAQDQSSFSHFPSTAATSQGLSAAAGVEEHLEAPSGGAAELMLSWGTDNLAAASRSPHPGVSSSCLGLALGSPSAVPLSSDMVHAQVFSLFPER